MIIWIYPSQLLTTSNSGNRHLTALKLLWRISKLSQLRSACTEILYLICASEVLYYFRTIFETLPPPLPKAE